MLNYFSFILCVTSMCGSCFNQLKILLSFVALAMCLHGCTLHSRSKTWLYVAQTLRSWAFFLAREVTFFVYFRLSELPFSLNQQEILTLT